MSLNLLVLLFLTNLFIYFNFNYISNFFNFFDKPDRKLKKHSKPVSLIGGSIILAVIAYGCFSTSAKDKCYYKNYRMKYYELKKGNSTTDKLVHKAEAARFALKACNIK